MSAETYNQRMYDLGSEPSVIRELFAYGMTRKAEIGADKVFDFSIGNPSVPAPQQVKDTLVKLLEEDPTALHGYSPAAGFPSTRQVVADHIRRNFGLPATADGVYLTAGAAGALAIVLAAVSYPGDEVIVVAPYFPEYKTFIENAGCTVVEVLADPETFALDVDAIEQAINDKTRAIIINSPNNPVGSVYSKENLEDLAAMLTRKEEELGRPLYIISDEPYRNITYGVEVPYIPLIYPDTIVCYSYSKALSLPGERIGYIYVSDLMENSHEVSLAVAGAGRSLGYVCAPVIFQRMLESCIDLPSDVEAYATNRKLLTEGLKALGYEYVEPQGAFYLWVKALEDDAKAFSERAKSYELLLVPSDSFGAPGWVRVSYCVGRDVIENSMPAFKALKESYDA